MTKKISDWKHQQFVDDIAGKPPFTQAKRSKASTWRDKIFPVLNAVQPVTRVVASAASIAVHLKKPTVMGVAMAASAGINTLRDLIGESPRTGHNIQLLVPRSYLFKAFEKQGGFLAQTKETANGNEITDIFVRGVKLRLQGDNLIAFGWEMDEHFLEWLRQILDAELPPVLDYRPDPQGRWSSTPSQLTHLRSIQGPKILSQTLPMLKNNRKRCILLTGIPGVGKSTMAQEIARQVNLGRVIQFDARAIGNERHHNHYLQEEKSSPPGSGSGSFGQCLKLMTPGVIIVDDIHRVHLSLGHIETLRETARLVIFTANLPPNDDGGVLDGAEIRSGRIDEVFDIKAEHANRQSPFDLLKDEDWERVRFWPIAFLNDLEVRLRERPDDLRLEDLERRIGMRTRSFGKSG